MDMFDIEDTWMYTEQIPFDHRVHEYSLEEVAERLEPHLGRVVRRTQIYPKGTSSLQGRLYKLGNDYFLDRINELNLSQSLTGKPKTDLRETIDYTLIEIDRTDLYRAAKLEAKMRESGSIN